MGPSSEVSDAPLLLPFRIFTGLVDFRFGRDFSFGILDYPLLVGVLVRPVSFTDSLSSRNEDRRTQ